MLISSYERQIQHYVYESLPFPPHAALQNSHGAKSDQKGLCPSLTKWILVFLALLKAIQRDENHSFYRELSLPACLPTQAYLDVQKRPP